MRVGTRVDSPTEVAACEGCGHDSVRVLRASKHGLRVGRCCRCGLVFVLNKPTSTELAELFAPTEAYELYVSAQRTTDSERQVACLEKLETLLGAELREKMLFDVGAGAGAFLAVARSRGFAV